MRQPRITLLSPDATALLKDALKLPKGKRAELAARLLAQESSALSANPGVMSGAPVTREQVIAFLEETKERVLAFAE